MADTKTSAMTQITENTIGDRIYVSQGGNDRYIEIENIGVINSWTPVVSFGGSSTGVVVSSSQCYEHRIGQMVTLTGKVNFDKGSTATGQMTISGFSWPLINVTNYRSASTPYVIRMGLANHTVHIDSFNNSSDLYMVLSQEGTAASVALTDTHITATGTDASVRFSFSYIAAK